MKTTVANGSFKSKLIEQFEQHNSYLTRNDTPNVSRLRQEGINKARELDFPNRKTEDWKHTDLKETLNKDYQQYLEMPSEQVDIKEIFICNVHNLETDQISLLNGWHVKTDAPLREHENGLISGGLSEAFQKYPELIDKHLGKLADTGKNIFHALNTAFSSDGVFIYVPDNVDHRKAYADDQHHQSC